MTSTGPEREESPLRLLLAFSIPALLIGVVSALVLWALDEAAALVQTGLWSGLPSLLHVDASSGWWIFTVLTFTGVAVGLVVWLLPGHAGPDSATTELVSTPLRLRTLPSLILATMLALAGGVSLGPENPIIAINASLLVAVVARLWKAVPTQLVLLVAAAGTIGAMFGTPVAAALVFTGVVAAAKGPGVLWDRLFLPLVAAGSGSLTMQLLQHPQFGIPLPAYGALTPPDVLAALVIAILATAIGLLGAWIFPALHRLFHGMRNPLLMTAAGGIVLGVLGALGGPITLFKGLEQMGVLVSHRSEYSAWALLSILAVKLVALLVSAASGFRGGRIFPAVFLGATVGVLATATIPSIPPVIAIGAGVFGFTFAIARDGWIAIFVALAVTQNATILPLLCLLILPTWLMITKGPQMLIRTPHEPAAQAGLG